MKIGTKFRAVGTWGATALLLVTAALLSARAGAQPEGKAMEKEFINPETLGKYAESFSQVVSVKAGGVKTIYVSGQVAVDKDGSLVGGEDLGEQAKQAFKNVSLALEAAGASTADVVKINVYIVGYERDKIGGVSSAMNDYFAAENRPASTWVWVQSLISRRFKIEIEVVAVVED